jgi:type IV secretory pathway component VirB8
LIHLPGSRVASLAWLSLVLTRLLAMLMVLVLVAVKALKVVLNFFVDLSHAQIFTSILAPISAHTNNSPKRCACDVALPCQPIAIGHTLVPNC